ncbi:MAG: type II toxin-antitoxin system HicA family toxin [Bacteroidia bacterium]
MKLPRISGRICVKALERGGFHTIRQKGSHIVMRKDKPFYQLVVPDHKELDTGTLRAIIRQSGMSIDEFMKLV